MKIDFVAIAGVCSTKLARRHAVRRKRIPVCRRCATGIQTITVKATMSEDVAWRQIVNIAGCTVYCSDAAGTAESGVMRNGDSILMERRLKVHYIDVARRAF